jgi:hypothetical protein
VVDDDTVLVVVVVSPVVVVLGATVVEVVGAIVVVVVGRRVEVVGAVPGLGPAVAAGSVRGRGRVVVEETPAKRPLRRVVEDATS